MTKLILRSVLAVATLASVLLITPIDALAQRGHTRTVSRPPGSVRIIAPFNRPEPAQDAINAALRTHAGSRTLWLSGGRYRISGRIDIPSGTTLYMSRSAQLIRDRSYSGTLIGSDEARLNRNDITIVGGTIRSGSNDGSVIRAWGNNWTIDNVVIRNFRGGIALRIKGDNHTITRCSILGPLPRPGSENRNGTAGIHAWGGTLLRINRCIVESGDDGIPLQPGSAGPDIDIVDAIVEDCTITSFDGAAIVAGSPMRGEGGVRDVIFRNIDATVLGSPTRGGSLATITNLNSRQLPHPALSPVRNILYQNINVVATGELAQATTGFAIRTRNGNFVSNVRVLNCSFGPADQITGFGLIIDQRTRGNRNNRDIVLRNSTFEGSRGARVTRPEGRFVNSNNTISGPVRIR